MLKEPHDSFIRRRFTAAVPYRCADDLIELAIILLADCRLSCELVEIS